MNSNRKKTTHNLCNAADTTQLMDFIISILFLLLSLHYIDFHFNSEYSFYCFHDFYVIYPHFLLLYLQFSFILFFKIPTNSSKYEYCKLQFNLSISMLKAELFSTKIHIVESSCIQWRYSSNLSLIHISEPTRLEC